MSPVPVISVQPDEPAWMQSAIAAINSELAAGAVTVTQLFEQIESLEARIKSTL